MADDESEFILGISWIKQQKKFESVYSGTFTVFSKTGGYSTRDA